MFRKLIAIGLVALMFGQSAGFAQVGRSRPKAAKDAERMAAQEPGATENQQPRARVTGLDAPVDPDTYVIGPYDEFVLILRGQDPAELRLTVLPEGNIILPNLGAFHVAGLTISEFRRALHESLDKYYRNIEIECQLVRPRTFVAYVLGEVEYPGPVQLIAPFRVSYAIEAVGGVGHVGSVRQIEIRENGTTIRTVDLFAFLHMGEAENNPMLREGQSVYVPVRQNVVRIFGEVRKPRAYEVLPGETLADVIGFAGGLTTSADADNIVVERLDQNNVATMRTVSSSVAASIEVKDRDLVAVPDKLSMGAAGYVQIMGGVEREGRVYIEDGETLRSFMPRLIRFTDEQNVTEAVLERRDDSGQVTTIPIDLMEVMAGGDNGSIRLLPGDVLSIPSSEAFVYVTGNVVRPGEIEYQKGLNVARYVAMAGGPDNSGSVDKITIYSAGGTKRKGNRESMVLRGETVHVRRKTSRILGSAFLNMSVLTGFVLSIVAVSRSN